MLTRHSWRHGAARHKYSVNRPLHNASHNMCARARKNSSRSQWKQHCYQVYSTNKYYHLLPGRVICFIHFKANKVYAVIQSQLTWKYCLPATRNMYIGQTINTVPRPNGSYQYAHTIQSLTTVSNIILPNNSKPTLLCAPGTSGRLHYKNKQYTLILKNKRQVIIAANALVQLGTNAAHDHWRGIQGGAHKTRIRVSMNAKNPAWRLSKRCQASRVNRPVRMA